VTTGPTVTSVTPNVIGQGGTETVVVTGSNFLATDNVTVNGLTVVTTFVDSSHLHALVTAPARASTGLHSVAVTATDKGTATCIDCLTVNARPSVTSSAPSSVAHGTSATLVISGANYRDGTNVTFSGTGITVNRIIYESPTQLKVSISVASGATTGARTITATNPDTGTGSCSTCFSVT
jgi:hypothetical protein